MARLSTPVRQGRIPLLLGMLLLVLPLAPLAAQQPRAVGTVDVLVGQAFVRSPGQARERALAVGSDLFEGDRIRTGPGARARLRFVDQTTVQMGESTELTLDWFLHAPDVQTESVLLRASAGILRVIVQALLPRSQFDLQTNTAVASVRGTDWIVEADPAATAIVALDGRVAVHSDEAAIAGEVLLGPGDGTTVRAEQPPEPAHQWGEARKSAFIEATTVR